MGSVGTQNPWGPYAVNRDCSQGICSVYCPQWCYLFFPPPPPFDPADGDAADDDSGSTLSPLIIAIISILASAFLLVGYYTVISKYCRRRGDNDGHDPDRVNLDRMAQDQWHSQAATAGLDEAVIRSIAVCKYRKGDGLVEGTDCAVCLSEFEEDESLRLLPKCSHAFHLPCIDTWLKSHSSCPLCRANIVSVHPFPLPAQNPQDSSNLMVSSMEIQRQDDLILVIEDQDSPRRRGDVLSFDPDYATEMKSGDVVGSDEENVRQPIRRSVSLGSFSSRRRQLLIADILRIDEGEEESRAKRMGIGSSNEARCDSNHAQVKRSVSAGRFMLAKGKNLVLPD